MSSRPKIGIKRRQRLIQDLIAAQKDLVTLAQEYHLSPDDLAVWIADRDNYQALHGLCLLADLQTQILLSRYRLLAAGRLIRLATGDGDEDVARRACLDLLKLDLKLAASPNGDPDHPKPNEAEVFNPAGDPKSLRSLLYQAMSDDTSLRTEPLSGEDPCPDDRT